MSRIKTTILSLTAAAALTAWSGPGSADEVSDFYKDRTVTIYVGYGPGGGYDAYARVLAEHMVKHIPGQPDSVVKNMPGAGSKTLANFLYGKAPADGTAFGIINSQIVMDPLLYGDEAQGVRYEPQKFSWIGSLGSFTPMAIVWHDQGIKSLEDAKGKEIKFGSSGGSLTERVYANMMNTMLGTNFVPVPGYKGSADISLAMERGEVPAFVGWYWGGMKRTKPHWIEKNLVNVLIQLGIESNPDMKGVPFILDLLEDPKDKQVAKLVLSNLAFARPFAAPPEVPEERLEALRSAFEKTTKDPAFLEAAQKAKLDIKLYTGAQIDALLGDVYSTPPDLIARTRKVMDVN